MFVRRGFSQSFDARNRPVVKSVTEWVDVFSTIVNYIFENKSPLYTHKRGVRVLIKWVFGCFLFPCICYSGSSRLLVGGRKRLSGRVAASDHFVNGVFETINK